MQAINQPLLSPKNTLWANIINKKDDAPLEKTAYFSVSNGRGIQYEAQAILTNTPFYTVYQGIDKTNNQWVLIHKIHQPHYVHYSTIHQSDLLKSHCHKNIIRIIDTIKQDNSTYIVAEYCGFGNLSNYWINEKKCNLAHALQIIYGIANGLEYLNQEKNLYEYITPDNIFLNNDYIPKVYCSTIIPNECLYKIDQANLFHYLAPEVLFGKNCTNKMHVWSLGVLLDQLLNDMKCFYLADVENISRGQILIEICNKEYYFRNKIIAKQYPPIEHLLKAMLAINPNDRFDIKQVKDYILQLTQNNFVFNDGNVQYQILKQINNQRNKIYLVSIQREDKINKNVIIKYASTQECKVCNKIQNNPHKNIIKIISIVPQNKGGKSYIITPYCKFGDLLSYKSSNDSNSIKRTLYIMIQISRAIQHLHRDLGITHGDIKLGNIVLNGHHIPKVIDFDSSSCAKNMKKLRGTTGYIAPEIMLTMLKQRESYTNKIDIWSLGLVFDCLFTEEESFYAVKEKINLKKKQDMRYMFDCIISKRYFMRNEWIKQRYPEIEQLLSAMITVDPDQRCKIEDVIDQLNQIYKIVKMDTYGII